jgi:hypothetical protein
MIIAFALLIELSGSRITPVGKRLLIKKDFSTKNR